jgi:hypothetical protein
MKINNLNATFEWETIRNIPDYITISQDFPSYNIKIKDKNLNLVEEFLNVKNYDLILEKKSKKIKNIPKVKFFANFSKSKVKNTFKYNFENNYNKYKKINNKIGFYKEFSFSVDFNNDGKGDFNVDVEYDKIENLNKNLLFNKIYRSSDYLTIKLLINKEYFNSKNIESFLILSEASNKIIKNKKLYNLFTEKVKEKWLDVNDQTALLTIPFIESDIVEISENINIKIIPLNFVQTEIYKFLKERETESDINNLYEEYFPDQYFNIGKIYKQAVNNEMLIFYQNYIYLFNAESLETNSLQTDLNINDITFNRYFPLLNKDQNTKTICLSDDLNTDDVLDNSFNLQRDYLGYYSKNMIDYEDIAIDIDYLQNQGVIRAKILEVEELADICNIYVEFITSFHNNERFYVETSNNLKFYERYKTVIDNKEYITFLFKYSYNLNDLNEHLSFNPNISKNQIISDKDLINFSAKLIL